MEHKKLEELLKSMTLEEKVGQMVQLMSSFYDKDVSSVLTGPAGELGLKEEDIRLAGSVLGTAGAAQIMEIQKRYMEAHPHHIPMLFMMDIIHGLKTIFPIPLAQGASFEPELTCRCAAAAAKEASISGLHVTFSPMADLVRDARWGRVMESTGEDPYLNSQFSGAAVRGYQGEDMSRPYQICACVKHFAGYGAPVAGRDYNTVELSEHTFREFYLPAYEAGIKAGAGMVMTSFNTVNGVPATVNKPLMRKILREEMGFDGVLISDYAAIAESVTHGYAENEEDAARKAAEAGVDIDMMTSIYASHLKELVREGKIEERLIDEGAMRVLELKNKLGLFENPFKDADPEKEKRILLCQEHRDLAEEAAEKSFVLLKNNGILPLDLKKKIAFIGPYTDRKEIMSTWSLSGNREDCVSIREAAEQVFDPSRTRFCQGSQILAGGSTFEGFDLSSDEGVMEKDPAELEQMMEEAKEAAAWADIVVMPLGEHYAQSGEASSRAMLDLPEVQMQLFRAVSAINSNIVVVLFNGRPLDLREISERAAAVLEVWLPGTEGGHAIVDTLTGKNNPSGKLPISFPYCVGQVPVYYNEYETGRPYRDEKSGRFVSRYIDITNRPLYPFGYGLSYTEFKVSEISLSSRRMRPGEPIIASVKVKNEGDFDGVDTIQLYIRDISASVVRPVKELKGFQKVYLEKGDEKEVLFRITEEELSFLRIDGTKGCEKGRFIIWIDDTSDTVNSAEFVLD